MKQNNILRARNSISRLNGFIHRGHYYTVSNGWLRIQTTGLDYINENIYSSGNEIYSLTEPQIPTLECECLKNNIITLDIGNTICTSSFLMSSLCLSLELLVLLARLMSSSSLSGSRCWYLMCHTSRPPSHNSV